MNREILISALPVLMIFQLPLLIVASTGLWLAIRQRLLLGRVFWWAASGFALLIVNSLTSGVVRLLIQLTQSSARAQSGRMAQSLDTTAISVWSLVSSLVFIVALAALTRAVFLDRNKAKALASSDDRDPGR